MSSTADEKDWAIVTLGLLYAVERQKVKMLDMALSGRHHQLQYESREADYLQRELAHIVSLHPGGVP